MNRLKELLRHTRKAPMLSPAGFVVRAAFILVLYVIARGLGLCEYASFLSGTMPAGALHQGIKMYLGVLYLLLYLGAVVGVPVLVIAAGVFYALDRRYLRRRTASPRNASAVDLPDEMA